MRSKEMILEFYDNSVVPLWKEFIATCSAFEDFYLKNERWIEINGNKNQNINLISILQKVISEETSRITLVYEFQSLKKNGHENFNFSNRYKIILSKSNSIEFRLSPTHKLVLKKQYNSPLTKEEIKLLCKEVKLQHTAALSQKV